MNNSEDNLEKIEKIKNRYSDALSLRQNWESHWDDCYEYTLPQRSDTNSFGLNGGQRTQSLYDATAMDAVDQLAASLLGYLTPPWTQWFGLRPGVDLTLSEAEALAPVLEDIAKKIQMHFDRSNFSVEIHQCFLDLVVGGTASLCFEESSVGEYSAFKFSAIPIKDIALEEGRNGTLDGSFRKLELTLNQLIQKFPNAELPSKVLSEGRDNPKNKFTILENISSEVTGYKYTAILQDNAQDIVLSEGSFNESPITSFRWMKSPGEIYGRSPVMKALPDIKTANKVVELILKNASIAVTGIWQADDDGVLNPANIELVPGAIIPKAVGSQGLKPLEMPGRFDVSELVLGDLRARIRHALLSDKLGPIAGKKMTATEVMERSSEMALLLGATYGRLQSELLNPLIMRAFSILKRRGEIPDIVLDGRYVTIDYRSPLARIQGQGHVNNVLTWLNAVGNLGGDAGASVNTPKTVQFLAESLGVPSDLIKRDVDIALTLPNVEGA